jgi:spore maturation protein CgeB
MKAPSLAFFGSSLVSAYWNGAATYYRGLLRALADRGVRVTFFEPDVLDRQRHRDIPDPDWARVVVYPAGADGVDAALHEARTADILVKASGVGSEDELLERRVAEDRRAGQLRIFWDVDAPATLARVHADPGDPFRACIPQYDAVFTYGGGPFVIDAYLSLGARRAVPIYNAVDPSTHFPVPPQRRFASTLTFLGNRLPDREARVHEFFLHPARILRADRFLLGGAGWNDVARPANVRYLGHVGTNDHNVINASAGAVLNVNRASMADVGFSPPTRVFEAAGAGACVISDRWAGIESFLEPGREILIASHGEEVVELLERYGVEARSMIGLAARRRVLAEHTYAHRASEVAHALALQPAVAS